MKQVLDFFLNDANFSLAQAIVDFGFSFIAFLLALYADKRIEIKNNKDSYKHVKMVLEDTKKEIQELVDKLRGIVDLEDGKLTSEEREFLDDAFIKIAVSTTTYELPFVNAIIASSNIFSFTQAQRMAIIRLYDAICQLNTLVNLANRTEKDQTHKISLVTDVWDRADTLLQMKEWKDIAL